jgi:Cu2+-exporting ATPase
MTDSCFHCGLPVPNDLHLNVKILGEDRAMCCVGCQAVAQAIVDTGMESYYQYRTETAPTGKELVPEFLNQIKSYDIPAIQDRFVKQDSGDLSEVSLILEGITCAACIWLNERYLSSLQGVVDVQINYTSHRARIRWDDEQIKLSDIIEAVSRIGYLAHPYDPQRQQEIVERERKSLLRRIGIAGVLGMQVMVLAVALYTGGWWGMEEDFQLFFRWASLLFTIPVITYAASPFFTNAWADIKRRTVGMDVPVSLGISIAFLSSIWATLAQQGEVYFDSVVMFTFFLLIARYFELIARRHTSEATDAMVRLQPTVATRLSGDNVESIVAVADLAIGDILLVRPGENIPADGVVIDGQTSVDESLLTGESLPVDKGADSTVIGGSINIASPFRMRVVKVGKGAVLSTILDMLDQATSEKPAISRFADRVAARFVVTILIMAAAVALFWWSSGSPEWIAITISVLVVTCPCALSLATPVAMSAATGRLTQLGLLTMKGHSIETLAQVEHFVFDKTGTLTQGRLSLTRIQQLSEGYDDAEILQVAAGLEAGSEHPIAKAIVNKSSRPGFTANNISNQPGRGVTGTIDGQKWYLGSQDFIAEHVVSDLSHTSYLQDDHHSSIIWLANEQHPVACLSFSDQLRVGALPLIQSLQVKGKEISIVSGDNEAAVRAIASDLAVNHYMSQTLPDDKLNYIDKLQSEEKVVAMLGDGVNDAPVLAKAQVSIAMGGGTQIASISADMVLLSDRLEHLIDALMVSQKTMRIVKQNIAWALFYNISAIPAAALGYIPPWLAAVGMSASSLVVVGNSLRILK